MVRLLFLKMCRDMRKSLSAYGICLLIVAVGFCGYSVLSVAEDNLLMSRDLLYERSAFADGFAEVSEAPAAVTEKLEEIPGIGRAQARIVKEARLKELGDGAARLKLIAYEKGGLNVPMLFQGMDAADGELQIVAGNAFLEAVGLQPGDTLKALVSGREVELLITGGGISPENIYIIRNIVEMLPDPENYDAGFVSMETMEALYGMEDQANSFAFTLESGWEIEDVKEQVEELLDPYGCYSVYGSDDHMSAAMLDSELDQLEQMAVMMPFLFLFVAAVVLYITMHRLMEQQRILVGTMLSMGITGRQVCGHYIWYGLSIGLAGGAAGGLLGNLFASPLVDYYRNYYNLPDAASALPVRYMLLGTVMAGSFCGAVSFLCARRLGRLSPSEALRPPAPRSAKPSAIERIPGILRLFTVPGVMALRNLGRSRVRSLLSLLGISCAFMITATLMSMNTLFDVFMFDNLEKVQRQDFAVYFEEPLRTADVLSSLGQSGIEAAEPFAEVQAKLLRGEEELDCTVQAIGRDATLTRLSDEEGKRVRVADGGIVLSSHMAGRLGVETGDWLDVKLTYPEERVSRVPVTGIMEQYMGTTAYMSWEGLGWISDYRDVCTGLFIKAASGEEQAIRELFEDAPQVTGVESRAAKLEKWRGLMGSFELMIGSMVFLGILIGLAVLYTSALISFEELKRDLSVMRMLGLRAGECLEVISVSQWILTVGGILMGIPMTFGVSHLLSVSLSMEMYSIPDFVDAASVAQSAVLMLIAVFLSSRMILRRLKAISPVSLLMERE
ncbi:MAG: FtsX-like permease family protein [Eubacteriales bacterium]|nr:FtsX-like permease family protein [Eubacteriales bacterium]